MAPCSQSRLPAQANPEPDFYCENHGSIYLLRPVSPAAFTWIAQNLLAEHRRFGNAAVVEWRVISSAIAPYTTSERFDHRKTQGPHDVKMTQ